AFQGLGNNLFWGDEGSTALAAKSFLRHGKVAGWEVPWDGHNYNTAYTSRFADTRVTTVDLQLDKFVAAAWFRIFGASTVSGRLPFVLFGLAALAVFWLLVREMFPASRALRWYAFLLVAFSYSFLLSIRQCQYYALVLFFAVLSYFLYRRFLRTRRLLLLMPLVLSLVLLFYSQYLLGACFCVALGVTHLAFHAGDFTKKEWAYVLGTAAVFAVLTGTYVLRTTAWFQPQMGVEGNTLFEKFGLVFLNLRELDLAGYLPGLVLAALGLFAWRYRTKAFFPSLVFEVLCFIGIYVVMLSLLSPQPVEWEKLERGLADIRYMIALLPLCACVVAAFLYMVHRGFGAVAASILLVVLLSANALSFNLRRGTMRWLLPAYLKEIHVDYTTPYEAVVDYLRAHATPADTVFVTPEYTHLSLLFYLSDSLTLGGGLNRHPYYPVEKLEGLGVPVFKEDYFPTVLICFGRTRYSLQTVQFFSRGAYEYVMKQRLNVYYKDMTRPELPWHSFGPVKRYNPATDAIYVFARRPKNP
ncbi:MAG: hypothetical protein GF418_13795, partial [Chitinivibrionales bacterium]|nr:hypothetical protein [Chitinivibrionales bacterium]MBD3396694.1 hypothetical protein [Chitinivibrionales bacterium]